VNATTPAAPFMSPSMTEHPALSEWNQTATPTPQISIEDLFLDQVKLQPNSIAVSFGSSGLTYTEVNKSADRISESLRLQGIGPEAVVGVCLKRGLYVIPVLLGILKAGGAFMPIDSALPDTRITFMLNDASVSIVITEPDSVDRISGLTRAPVFTPSELDAKNRTINNGNITRYDPAALAYVIYTSGSTGTPKGVACEHAGLLNYLTWVQGYFRLDKSDVVLQKTPFSFDPSIRELFWPLTAGARLHFANPGGHRRPDYLIETIRKEGITTIHFVPSMLSAFLSEPDLASLTSLRRVLCGGERLPVALLASAQSELGAQIYNLYGPTETTICSTIFDCQKPVQGDSIPIGRPIANSAVYLVNDSGALCVPGETGELYIGGVGLARGYLNHPDLTAASFLQNPYGPGRLYRSGDLARWRPDGLLEFIGRRDSQVKIRGHRIELGEVETTLLEHPAVSQAVVVVHTDAHGHDRLVAYTTGHGAPGLREIQGFVETRLPSYAIPSGHVRLAQMPLNNIGKLDTSLLPDPDLADRSHLTRDYVAPTTPIESALVALWEHALTVPRVGIEDNFYELGGDSIIALQIIARARNIHLKLTLRGIFSTLTIAGLAATATALTPESTSSTISRTVTGMIPLTPIQRRFLEQDWPQPDRFQQSALLATPSLNIKGLQVALEHVIAHHDSLRTRLRFTGGVWHQWIDSTPEEVTVASHDLMLHPLDTHAEVVRALSADAELSLDLEHGPIVRAVVCYQPSGALLILSIHHLAIDGVSWRVLLEDLGSCYAEVTTGRGCGLPAKTTSFQRWATLLDHLGHTDPPLDELAFWVKQPPTSFLPIDHEDGGNERAYEVTVTADLDPSVTWKLLHGRSVKINDVLVLAVLRALREWTGRNELTIDLEGHGREDLFDAAEVDTSRTIGWFTTIYPIRLVLTDGSDLNSELASVGRQLDAVPNHGIGYGILRYLSNTGLKGGNSQLLFNYMGRLDTTVAGGLFELADESMVVERHRQGVRAHELEVNSVVRNGILTTHWTFSPARFDEDKIRALATAYIDNVSMITELYSREDGAFGDRGLPLLAGHLREHEHEPKSYPLSKIQQGMLFQSTLTDGAYIVQHVLDYTGKVNANILRNAWQGTVTEHASLRSSFHTDWLEQHIQIVHSSVTVQFGTIDWAHETPDMLDLRMMSFLEEDRSYGFDLESAPPFRLTWIKMGPSTSRLVFTFHHIAIDGWSSHLIREEVEARYRALVRSAPFDDAPFRESIQPAAGHDADLTHDAQEFWCRYLANADLPALLSQNVPIRHSPACGLRRAHASFSDGLYQRLSELSRRSGCTVSTTLRAAWAIVLCVATGRDDVVFGVTVAGRSDSLLNADRMIGMFVNTAPCRIGIDPKSPIHRWLGALEKANVDWREFERTPLVDIYGFIGSQRTRAMFDTVVVVESYPGVADSGLDDDVRCVGDRVIEATELPLVINIRPGKYGHVDVTVDDELFNAGRAEDIASQFVVTLDAMVARSNDAVAELVGSLRSKCL